ncbi:tetratricopeptide repeat protein [Gymnodinialimonas sp. 2305UL16-5]|uniref:tetratricopeptide repeat protein n=1 Tax=Gymnodinialimonas mytili TaxID=3126503 RepID=UPI0030B44DCA
MLSAQEDANASERAAAVEDALAAFQDLAEASATEPPAERADAVAAARAEFEALAQASLARATEEAEARAAADRAAALAEARGAFEALAATSLRNAIEATVSAQRAEALSAASNAFEQLAAESAARAEAAAAAQAALDECVAIAGAPSAEVPLSEAAQQAAFIALREALPACRDAAEALPEEGVPFYHLATAAQAAGRHRRAIPLYETAAENGVAAALTRIGDYHNFGIRPIREDADQAVEFYRQAAEAGDVAGTATLAFMYRLGRGVPRDPAEMVRLMQVAADAGYPFAQANLGNTYLTGEGVPGEADEALGIPDARRAVPLLAGAARAGNTDAVQSLIELYSRGGPGVEPNDFLRFRWTNFLAETGDIAAQAERAFLFEQGIGRDRDPQFAAQEYVRLMETGEIDIDDLRGRVNGQVPPWDRETAEALQLILQERGLYQMAIDGAVGPGTRAAARALSE